MRQEPEGYDAFWSYWRTYRRRTDGRNKDKVQQRYQEALNMGATPEDILLAAQCHVRKLKQAGDLPYIELAATWLHSQCWVDEAEEQREFLARQVQPKRSENVIQMPKGQWSANYDAGVTREVRK